MEVNLSIRDPAILAIGYSLAVGSAEWLGITTPLSLDIPDDNDFLPPQQQRFLDESAILEAGGPDLLVEVDQAYEAYQADQAYQAYQAYQADQAYQAVEVAAFEAMEAAIVRAAVQTAADPEEAVAEYQILPGFQFTRQTEADRQMVCQVCFCVLPHDAEDNDDFVTDNDDFVTNGYDLVTDNDDFIGSTPVLDIQGRKGVEFFNS